MSLIIVLVKPNQSEVSNWETCTMRKSRYTSSSHVRS